MSGILASIGSWIAANSSALSGASAIASIAATGAGIGSAMKSYKKNRKFARLQDRIADENYRMQLADTWAMYERQMMDQHALIDEQNRYNDFSSIRSRANAAHVNPLVAITGQTGAGGIQSTAGNVPNPSTPSGYSPSFGGSDYGASSLISSGASLMANIKEFALLDEQIKSVQLANESMEIENKWKDKQLALDYQETEIGIALSEAKIGTELQQQRYVTSMAELNEQCKEFNESLNPLKIEEMRDTLNMNMHTIKQMEFKTDTQAEAFQVSIDQQKADIFSVYETLSQSLQQLEINRAQLGLNDKQVREIVRANKMLERQKDRAQSYFEKNEDRKFTRDSIIGYSNAFISLADCAISAISPIKSLLSVPRRIGF